MENREEMLRALRESRRECKKRPVLGERFLVPREGKPGVETILYRPKEKEGNLPVLFNLHGGGWIGGDAVLMDSFCMHMAEWMQAFVVNVNYTKVDEEPFPYAAEELADAVEYFMDHSGEYGVDKGRMIVGGHSAGAHLAAVAAILLKDRGRKLAGQMLVYPCVDLSVREEKDDDIEQFRSLLIPDLACPHPLVSPLLLDGERLVGLAPAVIVLCGKDSLRNQGAEYAKRLIDAAVPVKVKEYPNALHGFLEVCQREYPDTDERKTKEQAEYCRDCEEYLVKELGALL